MTVSHGVGGIGSRLWLAVFVVSAWVAAMSGCAAGGDDVELPQAEPGTVEVVVTEDVEYHDPDPRFYDTAGLLNVLAPDSGGPWPVVVAFHGGDGSMDKGWETAFPGPQVAEHGRVVFVPNRGHINPEDPYARGSAARSDLEVEQVRCAVAYAKEHAADYGGDPDHITVYGFSAGGNATLMAGFADSDLLEGCKADGPPVTPQAIVAIDADMLLGGEDYWTVAFIDDPDAFYSLTPWRHTDGSHEFPIHLLVTDGFDTVARDVGEEPYEPFLTTRHVDIDLAAELDVMGILDDGELTAFESNEWARESLRDNGYDPTWAVLPDSIHTSLSDEAKVLYVQAIVRAEDTEPTDA